MVGGKKSYFLWIVCVILLVMLAKSISKSFGYTHDQYGRILTETRTIDSTAVLSFRYTYNNKGQVSGVEYPENVNVDYLYDGYGNRTGMKVNNVLTWQMQQYSGKTSKSWYSGGLFSWQWLDGNGFIAKKRMSRGASTLHEMTFTHDGATGNLLERTGMFSYGEEFSYDDLDRLTSYTGQGGTKYITYEDNGNIQSHTDLGDYEYSQVKPHAVETVGGLLPGLQSAEGSTFTYNGFGKVSSINFSGMSQMSWRRLDFSYGPDRERWKTVRTMRGGLIPGPITTLAIPESSVNYVHTTNLYAGDYERINGTSYYYLDGGIIYVKPATGAGQAYYALTDHLGSYTRLYTMAGDSVLIASYDPWGNRTTTRNTLSFHRGFTGHEHLTIYGVINMNGRMYDPTVGRFLAPDNFVQMPDFSQSFNRYSYCLNNPLKYTDPSGEFLHLVVGALMGGMFNIIMNGTNIHNFWQGLGYFGIGAAAGAISAGIASGVNVAMTGGTFTSGFVGTATGISSTGFISGALTGAASGFAGAFISNTGNAWMEGESFTNGIWNGIKGGSISALIGGAVGGLMGGIDALSKKTNFWTGNASLDMSQAYSAFGPVIDEKTITGKYVGKFENVNVYESKMLGDASNGGIRGATLPGRGIIVSKGVYTRCNDYRLALLQHEYGHILQSKIVGLKAYYRVIARESFLSATFTSQEAHANFWTETWANYLSKNYFGADWFGYKISGYPAQDISIFNLNRLKKVGSLITSLIL